MISWLQDFGLVFDAAICLLLVTAIGYAAVLNRKLTQLRDAKRDMEKLFSEFATATNEAQGGLQALKDGSGVAGESLAKNVTDACRLADEMAFLVKKGNEIADRLEVQIAASRKASQAAATHTAPVLRPEAPQAPMGPQPTLGSAAVESGALEGMKPQAAQGMAGGMASGMAGGDGAPRGIAKLAKRKLSNADSELMRALQAIR